MTDSPVTLQAVGQRPPARQPRIASYIEGDAKPEIGRFAITQGNQKQLCELSA
ncbi:MAG: hypothetical protein IV106_18015 [Pseudomonas umsongensis]|uniref:Uncharacterized protein n=1 Tax=Pseudomonas umsongensis TaxID=198618 RepID=A0AAE6ZZS5_9PSED|nr:hypothetical protein [Pseudomonas umsongensis]MBT9572961.1 hypothetical protein [Pseudomonas umsongensis]QJC81039.1 hypothetical protein HGP31_23000 [Pseudomonas umsongensis]